MLVNCRPLLAALVAVVLFDLPGEAIRAQSPQYSVTSGVAREISSGETHDYEIQVSAGDLVSGPIELRSIAAVMEVYDSARASVNSFFFLDDPSQQRRVGFVAANAGRYRVSLKAYDAFKESPQVDPGPLVPVVGQRRGSYTLRLTRTTVAERMRGITVPVRVSYPSRRILQLAKDVEQGQREAVEMFWGEVKGAGPLIETIDGNDREADVTFLWRARYDTRNVLLVWSMATRADDYYLSNLPGTDVWYKTLRLRRDSRLPYSFSPNDRPQDRALTVRVDPLHSRVYPDDPTYPSRRDSVVELPQAPDQAWALRPASVKGIVTEQRFVSQSLKNERQVWIYMPPRYNAAAGPYPFVLLFDGAAYVSSRWLNAPNTLDNLIDSARIRPPIVCFVPAVNRSIEQGYEGADAYGDAIVQELLPMLRKSYAITTDPRDIVVGGYSNGGLAAALVALKHPTVFGNVLSQSGSFRQPAVGSTEPNSIAQMFIASPRLPVRFYMETGAYDSVPAGASPLHELVLDETNTMGNRHLRDVLRAKGYDVIYRETGGGHDNVHWRSMLADGLAALLAP
jgi:enterochelin esterase-like enzyme